MTAANKPLSEKTTGRQVAVGFNFKSGDLNASAFLIGPRGDGREMQFFKKKPLLYFALPLLLTLCAQLCPFAKPLLAADLGEIVVFDDPNSSSAAPTNFTTVIKPSKEAERNMTAGELIRTSPGVEVKDLGGAGQYSTVTIRGSSAEQVVVFIDGVRINSPTGGGVDFSTIPVEQIERIEVIRGGGTAKFGPNAIGGVINIVTKRAGKGTNFNGQATYGSFKTFKAAATLSIGREKWRLVESYTHAQSGGAFTFKSASTQIGGVTIGGGKTYARLHNGFISEDLLSKFSYDSGDNLSIDASNDFFFTHRDVPGMEEETTQLYPQNPLEAKETIFRNLTGLRAKLYDLLGGKLTLESGFTNNFTSDKFTDPSPAIGGPINQLATTNTLNPYFLISPTLKTRHLTNITTLRLDLTWDYFKDSSPIPTAPVSGRHDRATGSTLLQNELWLLDEKLGIIPSFIAAFTNDKGNGYGGKIGLIAKPANFATFKANAERSFRFPNFSELYFPDQGYMRGNSNLSDEKANNFDAGIVLAFGRHKVSNKPYLSFEGTFFYNDVKNQIIWVPVSATTIEPVNTFGVTSKGIETALIVSPLEWLDLSANYTLTDAHFKKSRAMLAGQAKNIVNAKIDVSHKIGSRLTAGYFSKFNYTSKLPVNTSNTLFLAGRSTIDAGAALTLDAGKSLPGAYTLTFEAKDITNVQVYDARGFPLPRRSFFVTLSGGPK